MNPVSMKLNVPDLWFDFFARFLPGIVFITILRFYFLGNQYEPSYWEIVVIIFAGYISALLFQPISTKIVSNFELSCQPDKKDTVRQIIYEIGENSHEALVLEKMHGEATFYMQLAILLFVDALTLFIKSVCPPIYFIQYSSQNTNIIAMALCFIVSFVSFYYSFVKAQDRFGRAKRAAESYKNAQKISNTQNYEIKKIERNTTLLITKK